MFVVLKCIVYNLISLKIKKLTNTFKHYSKPMERINNIIVEIFHMFYTNLIEMFNLIQIMNTSVNKPLYKTVLYHNNS